jgi:hypothetical protein
VCHCDFYFKEAACKQRSSGSFSKCFIFSANSIRFQLHMTCCVSTVSCKVGDSMSVISQTNNTVTFRSFIFVNMVYITVERRKLICVQFIVQPKRRYTDSVHTVKNLVSILYRQYFGHVSYLLHRKSICTCHTYVI